METFLHSSQSTTEESPKGPKKSALLSEMLWKQQLPCLD